MHRSTRFYPILLPAILALIGCTGDNFAPAGSGLNRNDDENTNQDTDQDASENDNGAANINDNDSETIQLTIEGCPDGVFVVGDLPLTLVVSPETAEVTVQTEAAGADVQGADTLNPTIVDAVNGTTTVTAIATTPSGATATANCEFEGCLATCIDDAECDDGLFCNGQEYCVADTCPTGCFDGDPPCTDDEICEEENASCRPDACQIVNGNSYVSRGLANPSRVSPDGAIWTCDPFEFLPVNRSGIQFQDGNAYCWTSDVVGFESYTCDGEFIYLSNGSVYQASDDIRNALRIADGSIWYIREDPIPEPGEMFVEITGIPDIVPPCANLPLTAEVSGADGEVTYEWHLSRTDKFSFQPGTETQQTAIMDVDGWYCNISGMWLLATDESGRSAAAVADLPSPERDCSTGSLGGSADPPGWWLLENRNNAAAIISFGQQVTLLPSLCGQEAEAITWTRGPYDLGEAPDFIDNGDGTATFTAPATGGLVDFLISVDFGGACVQDWVVFVGIGPGP